MAGIGFELNKLINKKKNLEKKFVPKIYEFADLETGVNLAISLHAPNNEIRDKIMKVNHAYKIEEVMKALDYYIEKTNRRVTVEYVMLAGINDCQNYEDA